MARPHITVCTVAKNEEPYLLEWVAHYRALGVDKIVIYDNESSDDSWNLLSKLRGALGIECYRWPTPRDASPQLTGYANAIARNVGQTDFIALFDADEFLMPLRSSDLHAYLAEVPNAVGAIAVNQRVFGSSGHERSSFEPVTKRFSHAALSSYEENRFFKSIVRPERVERVNDPHFVYLRSGKYVDDAMNEVQRTGTHQGCSDKVSHENFQLNHYILKSREEFERKRQRGGGAGGTAAARIARMADDTYFTGRDPNLNRVICENTIRWLPALEHELAVISSRLDALHEVTRPKPLDEDARTALLGLRHNTSLNFENIIEEFYSCLPLAGSAAIDAGAHLGRHTYPLSALVGAVGEVIAYEPIPTMFENLRRDKTERGITNIRMMPVAIADKAGTASFNWVRNSEGYSSMADRKLPFDAEITTLKVDVTTLDELPLDKAVRFIKLDIEGAEYSALVGAKRLLSTHRPVIVLENHGQLAASENGYTADEFFQLFEGINYQLFDLFGNKYDLTKWDDPKVPVYTIAIPSEWSTVELTLLDVVEHFHDRHFGIPPA